MTRPIAALALLALSAVASAQDGASLPPGYSAVVGPPVLGGRWVSGPPITNGTSALYPVQTPVPPRFSVGGGSMSAYPQVWLPSGAWGGVNYPWPVSPIEFRFNPAQAAAAAVQAEATLVVQFPEPAEIWVDGKKRDGDPATEWTLTSPALGMGEWHKFEVKARWKAGGTAFEASRSVTVSAGARSRLIVASGSEVKE